MNNILFCDKCDIESHIISIVCLCGNLNFCFNCGFEENVLCGDCKFKPFIKYLKIYWEPFYLNKNLFKRLI